MTDSPNATHPDFSLGERLQSTYPLLHIVFGYLDYKDLLSASAVSKPWREVASNERRKRQRCSWFSCVEEGHFCKLNRGVDLLRNNPRLCVALVNCSPDQELRTQQGDGDSDGATVAEYLQKNVLGYPFRDTVALAPTDRGPCANSWCERKLIEGLTLPEIPGVRTVVIRTNGADRTDIRQRYVKESETVNSLFIFCETKSRRVTEDLLTLLLDGQQARDVAVAGGYRCSFRLGRSRRPCRNITCVAFLQPKNEASALLSYSLVVDESEEVEAVFRKFRRKITLRSQSAALKFTCYAKSIDRCEEVTAFSNVFPDTLLLSVDVDGEIGWDTILDPDVENPSRPKRAKTGLPLAYHELTSVVLLITWDS